MERKESLWLDIGVPSGQPDGLRVIHMDGWSGVALYFPRSKFRSEARGRNEMQRPGIYVLWGDSEDGQMLLYIGETDSLADRLTTHFSDRDKEFWNETIILTTIDGSLNKAHVRFIESELITMAQAIAPNREFNVLNSRTSQPPNLTERDVSAAQRFLKSALLCMAIAGVPFFNQLGINPREQQLDPAPTPSSPSPPQPTLLFLRGGQGQRATDASGYVSGGEFVILAGAKATKEEAQSASQSIRNQRAKLVEEGHLVDRGDHLELVSDHVFGSASSAAQALLGRSSNGLREWLTGDGIPLRDL